MEFKQFNKLLQKNVARITKNVDNLYVVDLDKDVLWNTYLDSFPPGTNEIFRERREFDCSCCRQFIKNFGSVVTIENGVVHSIWDFKTKDSKFQPVINALSALVKSKPIKNVFVTKDKKFGTLVSREFVDNKVIEWDHFFVKIKKDFIYKGYDTIDTVLGQKRDTRNVLERSLTEISKDAIDTVLDLISQNSLYKGREWQNALEQLKSIQKKYNKANDKNTFCWDASVKVGPAIGRIKNHSIGVLLQDITSGMDLDVAVRRYESIVAPNNYKRPKAIFSKKMVKNAQKLLEKEGLIDSLGRRYAVIEDITINNILYANRDAVSKIKPDSVFDELKAESVKKKKLGKVEEISIDKFVSDVLPSATDIELLLENKHCGNLVSLIAPQNKDSKTLFKWNNNFSWAYNGNITDSMKEKVKSAGGKVDGVLRFSIQWNTEGDNNNDFDAHCKEPCGNVIYYGRKINHSTGGNLDIDIINPRDIPSNDKTAVENITWPSIDKMKDGVYTFLVHNYTHRGGTSGFQAEIEFDGKIFSFLYNKDIKNNEKVEVAKVRLKDGKFEMIKSLPSLEQSKTVWNLKTNEFHPVSVCMYSPNYWDEQKGIGNRHYFFMLKKCVNDGTPNGFFNEFLKEEMMKHKKVFEALGSKMKVDSSDNQLSGVGFSDTKRNSVTLRVKGTFTRTLVVNF